MASTPPIQGYDAVVSALGAWPSFHDAEVLHFSLSRGHSPEEKRSTAQLAVLVRDFEPRNEGTVAYEVALVSSVVIRLEFEGVREIAVTNFNHQNVIETLRVEPLFIAPAGQLRVEVESIYGFGATWLCTSARVACVSDLQSGEA